MQDRKLTITNSVCHVKGSGPCRPLPRYISRIDHQVWITWVNTYRRLTTISTNRTSALFQAQTLEIFTLSKVHLAQSSCWRASYRGLLLAALIVVIWHAPKLNVVCLRRNHCSCVQVVWMASLADHIALSGFICLWLVRDSAKLI